MFTMRILSLCCFLLVFFSGSLKAQLSVQKDPVSRKFGLKDPKGKWVCLPQYKEIIPESKYVNGERMTISFICRDGKTERLLSLDGKSILIAPAKEIRLVSYEPEVYTVNNGTSIHFWQREKGKIEGAGEFLFCNRLNDHGIFELSINNKMYVYDLKRNSISKDGFEFIDHYSLVSDSVKTIFSARK